MSRNYRGDIEMGEIEKFLPLVLEQEEEGSQSPVVEKDGINFCFIRHRNLYCKLIDNNNKFNKNNNF